MTRRKELQNDITNIRLGQLLVCALIWFPVQVLLFRSPWRTNRKMFAKKCLDNTVLPKFYDFPRIMIFSTLQK